MFDVVHETLLLVVEDACSFLGQEVREADNRIQWGAQFMAHAGEKLALHARGAFDFAIPEFQFSIAGSQLLGDFALLLFIPFLLRDIDGNNYFCMPAGEVHRVRSDLHVDFGLVFLKMLPYTKFLNLHPELHPHFRAREVHTRANEYL